MSDERKYVKPNDYMVGGTHYKDGIQPWEVIDHWSLEQQIGYHKGNILKYTMRLGHKPGNSNIQEAEKIRHYAEKLIEVLHKKGDQQW